jgi:hypothetical protein
VPVFVVKIRCATTSRPAKLAREAHISTSRPVTLWDADKKGDCIWSWKSFRLSWQALRLSVCLYVSQSYISEMFFFSSMHQQVGSCPPAAMQAFGNSSAGSTCPTWAPPATAPLWPFVEQLAVQLRWPIWDHKQRDFVSLRCCVSRNCRGQNGAESMKASPPTCWWVDSRDQLAACLSLPCRCTPAWMGRGSHQ